MGSARRDVSSQKAIEGDLRDAGKSLLRLSLPSSTDELLIRLEKTETLLAKVWQQPPESTCKALLPAMNAVIRNEVLNHQDLNVQVAVASCFSELTRISAPDLTYGDARMMKIFRLFMIALKQLSCESGPNYSRALKILEHMAKLRSYLILLDIDTDGLIVEIFQIFLSNIRSSHPSDVFKYMETIMTLVLEESEEISTELLSPLLASVKIDNKNTSPTSGELGKKIFENCATKLQVCLIEAVKTMNLQVDDYAEIVASICNDKPNGKNMVLEEVAPTIGEEVSPAAGLPEAVHEDCTPQFSDDEGTKLEDEKSMETLKGSQQIVHSGTDTGALRRKRRRKPSSMIRPEEGYKYAAWTIDAYREEKKYLPLPSELGNGRMLGDRLRKTNDPFSEGSLLKRGQPKKKKRTNNQDNDLESLSMSKRNILQSKVKERVHNTPKKIGNRTTAELSNNRVDKEERTLGDQEQRGRKENFPQKYVKKAVMDNMERFPISEPKKAKGLQKDKEKKSRRSGVGCPDELVNLRIQVWWPMDETYYPGTVKAYDPVTKKHTILYDDDETEILNLRKETWLLFDEQHPPQRKEADDLTPPKEPVKIQEKTAKRKAVSSRKQNSASSSKRSKSEDRSINKPGYNSTREIFLLTDESDDEVRETNVEPKVGDNHASKDESETLTKENGI